MEVGPHVSRSDDKFVGFRRWADAKQRGCEDLRGWNGCVCGDGGMLGGDTGTGMRQGGDDAVDGAATASGGTEGNGGADGIGGDGRGGDGRSTDASSTLVDAITNPVPDARAQNVSGSRLKARYLVSADRRSSSSGGATRSATKTARFCSHRTDSKDAYPSLGSLSLPGLLMRDAR